MGGRRFLWTDYLSLRQGKSGDFHPQAIVELMTNVETLVADVDRDKAYVGRSFCMLEVFAAVLSKRRITSIGLKFGESPPQVKSHAATTRYPEDKQLIDQ